jgi:hypothetical protein
MEICGNGTDDDCDGLTDENCSSTLGLRLLIEGIYTGNGRMTAAADPLNDTLHSDTVTVQLAVSASPYTRVHSLKILLARDGSATANIPSAFVGSSYYLVIRHRNSLETWSSVPIAITAGTVNYDFTDAGSKAFGNNLKSSGDGYFSLFSGDVNQDNVIDFSDLADFDTVSTQHQTGYVPCDINGDRVVESSDGSLIENNASGGRQSIRP